MTIPGVDATVALSIVAAVGDFARFSSPQKLVSYLGLNPRVRQSGGQPASHGRITKQGRAHARGMLVEAAWAAVQDPGPAARLLRARPRPPRDADRRRRHRAQARRALLAPDHQAARTTPSPALADRPEAARARAARRHAPPRGQKGKAAAYSLKEVRRRETALTEQAEQAYRQLVADWQAKAPGSEEGRGRRQRGATLKALNGASCAAGLIAPDPALRSGSTTP